MKIDTRGIFIVLALAGVVLGKIAWRASDRGGFPVLSLATFDAVAPYALLMLAVVVIIFITHDDKDETS
jgi:hypothetical protein